MHHDKMPHSTPKLRTGMHAHFTPSNSSSMSFRMERSCVRVSSLAFHMPRPDASIMRLTTFANAYVPQSQVHTDLNLQRPRLAPPVSKMVCHDTSLPEFVRTNAILEHAGQSTERDLAPACTSHVKHTCHMYLMPSASAHLRVVLAQFLSHGGVQSIGGRRLIPSPVLCKVCCGTPANHGRHALRYLKRSPGPLIRHRLHSTWEIPLHPE